MRISDWSSDVCSSDLLDLGDLRGQPLRCRRSHFLCSPRFVVEPDQASFQISRLASSFGTDGAEAFRYRLGKRLDSWKIRHDDAKIGRASLRESECQSV